MVAGKRVLAVVPARGGSKRIKQKNLQDLGGIPLIAHTIIAAQKCAYIDKLLVSSDDAEILAIAQRYGCVIDKRKNELATDEAHTIDVLRDVLNRYDNFDILVTLQPTSPLRTTENITEALDFYVEKNSDAVISVCEVNHPPHWSNTLDETLKMDNFISPSVKKMRSQDLGNYYKLNGAIYVNKVSRIAEEPSLFFEENSHAYIMERKLSVDIDTLDDLMYARYLLSQHGS